MVKREGLESVQPRLECNPISISESLPHSPNSLSVLYAQIRANRAHLTGFNDKTQD